MPPVFPVVVDVARAVLDPDLLILLDPELLVLLEPELELLIAPCPPLTDKAESMDPEVPYTFK